MCGKMVSADSENRAGNGSKGNGNGGNGPKGVANGAGASSDGQEAKLPARPKEDPSTELEAHPLKGEHVGRVDFDHVSVVIAQGVSFPTFSDALAVAEPGMLFVDGICKDTTQFVMSGKIAPVGNINHHQGADAKSSTMQFKELIRNERDLRYFMDEDGMLNLTIVINHPDGDTISLAALAEIYKLLDATEVPGPVRKWVDLTDAMDTHSGLYSGVDFGSTTAKMMSYLLNPYMVGRSRPGASDIFNIVTTFQSSTASLVKYLAEGVVPKDLPPVAKKVTNLTDLERYEDLVVPPRLHVITAEEIFTKAALAKRKDDMERFVSVVRERNGEDSEYGAQYVVGKLSPYGAAEMALREQMLNAAEKELGTPIDKNNNWGGNLTVKGSPRKTGSLLNPYQLVAIEGAIAELEAERPGTIGKVRLTKFKKDVLPRLLEEFAEK